MAFFHCFRYCVEILATLPFTSPDEPLYLIYDINRVLQLRAGAIEANMKMWSSFAQEAGSVKVVASNELNEDPVENNVSKQHLESALENTSAPTVETLQKFQVIPFLFIYFSESTISLVSCICLTWIMIIMLSLMIFLKLNFNNLEI